MGVSYAAASSENTEPGTPFDQSQTIWSCSAWCKPVDATLNTAVVSQRSKTDSTAIMMQMDLNADTARILVRDNAGNINSAAVSGPADNTWGHFLATRNGNEVQVVYDDGTPATEAGSTIGTISAADAPGIGVLWPGNSSGSAFWDGSLAEVAFWAGIKLAAAEIAALAKGCSPLLVRPASLTHYWRMRNLGEVSDQIGRNALTHNNTPTSAGEHPLIIYPRHKRIITMPSAVVAEEFLGRQYPQGVMRGVMRGAA